MGKKRGDGGNRRYGVSGVMGEVANGVKLVCARRTSFSEKFKAICNFSQNYI